jgi:serine/threonine-protein kinase
MIGETIGNYKIVLPLGSGSMGHVFLGEHERIARKAAIKVLSPELAHDAAILERFFVEARATSLIHHPAIVEVLDCGIHGPEQRPYIVMEYVPGETLAALLERKGQLPWREACETARRIADGLAAAHRHRIVHRDLKPANVMLGGDPGTPVGEVNPTVKLLDFGVAKLLHAARSRTFPGELLGTPEYMAPEQCGGRGGVGERTDIYGLGCVLFEMITGRLPFTAAKLGDLILAHQWTAPPPLSAHAEVPAELDRLMSRMLAKQPEDRPAEMAAVAQALAELMGDRRPVVSARVPARVPARVRARVPARRVRLLAAGGIATIALVLAGGHLLRPRKPVAPTSVEHSAARAPAVQPSAGNEPAPAAPALPDVRAAERVPAARPAPSTRRRRPPQPLQVDADGIVHL